MEIIENRNAQFMLLAGFIIAISLVITTVILTSIIFEINTAVGAGTDPSKNEIDNLMQITKYEIRDAYRKSIILQGDTKYNFSKQMNTFNGNLSKIYALHGESVNVSWDISNWNNLNYPNFTENGSSNGVQNWTVIENVNEISDISDYGPFELKNVSGSDFEINISNQTTGAFLWSMKLNGIGSIRITNYTGITTTHGVNFAYIDLLDPNYRLVDSIGSNSSKIRFISGAFASGRYKITVTPMSGDGFTRARDYNLNVTVTYSTSRVRANSTLPFSVPW